MNIFMSVVGIVLLLCGIHVGYKRGSDSDKENQNGILEWILAGIGLLLMFFSYEGMF